METFNDWAQAQGLTFSSSEAVRARIANRPRIAGFFLNPETLCLKHCLTLIWSCLTSSAQPSAFANFKGNMAAAYQINTDPSISWW